MELGEQVKLVVLVEQVKLEQLAELEELVV